MLVECLMYKRSPHLDIGCGIPHLNVLIQKCNHVQMCVEGGYGDCTPEYLNAKRSLHLNVGCKRQEQAIYICFKCITIIMPICLL